jgi:hypothetical protein
VLLEAIADLKCAADNVKEMRGIYAAHHLATVVGRTGVRLEKVRAGHGSKNGITHSRVVCGCCKKAMIEYSGSTTNATCDIGTVVRVTKDSSDNSEAVMFLHRSDMVEVPITAGRPLAFIPNIAHSGTGRDEAEPTEPFEFMGKRVSDDKETCSICLSKGTRMTCDNVQQMCYDNFNSALAHLPTKEDV